MNNRIEDVRTYITKFLKDKTERTKEERQMQECKSVSEPTCCHVGRNNAHNFSVKFGGWGVGGSTCVALCKLTGNPLRG